MSKRKTVCINLDTVGPLIKERCRSNAVFCEKMGRAIYWVTDWHRKDENGNSKPKNLPSPEEAAKMCEILSVEPQNILVRPEDIALVQSLIDEKKQTENSELDDATKELQDIWGNADEATKEAILAAARMFKARGG